MEIAAPNMSIMIIAVKILGAAEGFLPSALMLAKPAEAMISEGPKIVRENISTKAACLFNVSFPPQR